MQEEGNLTGSSSLCGALPLLVDLSDDLTTQSLCRTRMYVNLLTNPPPQPHPFAVFLEEASRLKTAAGVTTTNSASFSSSSYEPAMTSDIIEEKEGKTASNEDNLVPSLLEALQQKHGYSSGSALYRIWVQRTQDYLSLMSQRIADAVLTHAIPLVVNDKPKDPQSSSHLPSNGYKDNKMMSMTCEGISQYDIHVRFLPSPAPRIMIDPSLAQAFCAEIIVRDVAALHRREMAASLLRARYTAVAAEGQTVQSALAFWRAVQMDAAVEEEEDDEEENGEVKDGNKGKGRKDKEKEYNDEREEEDTMALGIGASSAVVLGRSSEKTSTWPRAAVQYGDGNNNSNGINADGSEEKSVWVQPQVKQTRHFNNTHISSSSSFHSTAQKRQRTMMTSDSTMIKTTTTTELPKAPLQSTAGLVAVFYLATNGVLYTGNARGLQKGSINVQTSHPFEISKEEKKTENKKSSVEEKPTEQNSVNRDSESVFFLPCASSSSFLRGLLGL